MGFLDKLKGAVNTMTGGGAKVTLEWQPNSATRGQALAVKVTVTSTGAEVKSDGIFVDLRSQEMIHIDDRNATQLDRDLHLSNTTFKQEIRLSGPFVLAAGATQVMEGSVTIPADQQPSFKGKWVKNEWNMQGRLEAFGNDPDSGWLEFEVR